jgi:hypothetical protein
MKISNARRLFKLTISAIVVMVFGYVNVSQAQQHLAPDFEQRVARTLLDTIRNGLPKLEPSKALVQEYKDGASDKYGPSWGVVTLVNKSQWGRYKVKYAITVLPDNFKYPAKYQKGWARVVQKGIKDPTGAGVGYRLLKKGDVTRNKVFYRLREGNVAARMDVIFPGSVSKVDSLQKAAGIFRIFDRNARENGVLGGDAPELVITYLQPGGERILEADEVVNEPLKETREGDEFRFSIAAKSPVIVPNRSYNMEFKLEPLSGAKSVEIVHETGHPMRDVNNDGWLDWGVVKPGAPVGVIVKMDAFKHKDPKTGKYVIEDFVVVRVRIPIGPKDPKTGVAPKLEQAFGIQRRSWDVVVNRFEIIPGNGYESQSFTPNKDQRYELDGRLGFNDLVTGGGQLIENYQKLKARCQIKRTQKIFTDEAVCMSWQRDTKSQKTYQFLVAVDHPDIPQKLSLLFAKMRYFLALDLKVVQAPKRTSLKPKQGDDSDFGGGADGLDSELENGLKAELAIRKNLVFEELDLNIFVIEEFNFDDPKWSSFRLPSKGKDGNVSAQEETDAYKKAYYPIVAKIIRQIPTKEVMKPFYQVKFDQDARFDTYFPLTFRYENPPRNEKEEFDPLGLFPADNSNLIQFIPRYPGAFEIRLHAVIVNRIRVGERRKIDVAIRFTSPGKSFRVHNLEWTGRRLNQIP